MVHKNEIELFFPLLVWKKIGTGNFSNLEDPRGTILFKNGEKNWRRFYWVKNVLIKNLWTNLYMILIDYSFMQKKFMCMFVKIHPLWRHSSSIWSKNVSIWRENVSIWRENFSIWRKNVSKKKHLHPYGYILEKPYGYICVG